MPQSGVGVVVVVSDVAALPANQQLLEKYGILCSPSHGDGSFLLANVATTVCSFTKDCLRTSAWVTAGLYS